VPGEALADLYVRHAMPLLAPDLPSSQWDLGPAGRAAAKELAGSLSVGQALAIVVSSTEPKAVSTAVPIAERFAVELRADARLVEVRRPWIGSAVDYRALAHRYLAGGAPEGWEDRASVAERMAHAVLDAREVAGGGAVAVVGHGLSLCVHLESQLPAGFDPGSLWARLAFPDAWTVDRADLYLARCSR
jgi:broad specificity phosphatase PhoE